MLANNRKVAKTNASTGAGPNPSESRILYLRMLWHRAARGIDLVVKSGTYGGYLPQGIYGVDLKGGYELRECLLGFGCRVDASLLPELREGRRLELVQIGRFVRFVTVSEGVVANLIAKENTADQRLLDQLGSSCSVRRGDTSLADYAEYRVRECIQKGAEGYCRLRVYARYVAPLDHGTVERLVSAAGIAVGNGIAHGQTDAVEPLRLQPYKLSDAELRASYDSLKLIDFKAAYEGASGASAKDFTPGSLPEEDYASVRAEEDRFVEEILASWKAGRGEVGRQERQIEERTEALGRERADLDARRADVEKREKEIEKSRKELDDRLRSLDERSLALEEQEKELESGRNEVEAERARLEGLGEELERWRGELDGWGRRLEESWDELAKTLEAMAQCAPNVREGIAALQDGLKALDDLSVSIAERKPVGDEETVRETTPQDGTDVGPVGVPEGEAEGEETGPQIESEPEPWKKKFRTPQEMRLASQAQARLEKQELIKRQMEKQKKQKKK